MKFQSIGLTLMSSVIVADVVDRLVSGSPNIPIDSALQIILGWTVVVVTTIKIATHLSKRVDRFFSTPDHRRGEWGERDRENRYYSQGEIERLVVAVDKMTLQISTLLSAMQVSEEVKRRMAERFHQRHGTKPSDQI